MNSYHNLSEAVHALRNMLTAQHYADAQQLTQELAAAMKALLSAGHSDLSQESWMLDMPELLLLMSRALPTTRTDKTNALVFDSAGSKAIRLLLDELYAAQRADGSMSPESFHEIRSFLSDHAPTPLLDTVSRQFACEDMDELLTTWDEKFPYIDHPKRSRVMIIDDETINLQVLENLLQEEYDVALETSGMAALERVDSWRPDLILLDVMMPDIDGYEVCRMLKKKMSSVDIPVIFITALDDQHAEAFGLGVGAVDYVTKPINPQAVSMRVRNHLDLKHARDKAMRANLRNRDLIAQMKLQKEEAERANMAKTRFLAAASHDLRQPMHTISLLVGLLQEQAQNSQENHLIGKIHEAVYVMEKLFCNLLDISTLDTGTVKPKKCDFLVNDILHLVELNYGPQAHAKGLDFRIVRSSMTIHSDPALLVRIVGNLVSNAIKYTQKGTILVGCRRRRDGLAICVYDTGEGIPQTSMEDIFEEFFQLANPERDRNKGLGLGLSIVKRASELLEHPLAVASILGKGSLFSIDVPLVLQNALPIAAQTLPTDVTAADSIAGAFVLVIDDEPGNRFATEAICSQWQCHVLAVGSVAEAVDQLKQHWRLPDLIISDYRLRDNQNGLTAIQTIRDLAEDENLPAMIITGDIACDAIQDKLSAGLVLVHKPVSAYQLHQHAIELLSTSFNEAGEAD